jgi:hypothetical protein
LPQTTFYYLYNGQGMQKTLPLCLSFAPSQLVTELFGSCLAWSLFFGSERTLKNVECELHSQTSSGIFKTTADYFLVPYC